MPSKRALTLCRVTLLSLLAAVAFVGPAGASAAGSAPGQASAAVQGYQKSHTATPLLMVHRLADVPVGFHSSAAQAVAAAKAAPAIQALHRHEHPLWVAPYVYRDPHPYWYVQFKYRNQVAAEVDVSQSGQVRHVWTGPQAIAPYTHGHYSWLMTKWWLLLGLSLLFLLPFFDPRRWRSLVHLDALTVLSFLASYLVLDHAHLNAAVWLVYPPLIYLGGRLLWRGLRGAAPRARLAPLLSTRALIVGLLVLVAGRLVLSVLSDQVIDVGYGSVVGAFRLLHQLPLYFNDPGHGDTYGPITYLAYVPFVLIFHWSGDWGNLQAGQWAAVAFDLLTILALVFLGRRLRAGREGTRLGLVLAWGWAACPFTVLGLVVHTNDALVSLLVVLALVAFASPAVSGAMLGLAAAAKFSPAAIMPLLAAPRTRGLKRAIVFAVTFTVVAVGSVLVYLPPQGLGYFWQRTIGFQLGRTDVFSPWALHPGLHPLQLVVEVAVLALLAVLAFVPRQRTLWQVTALAGAATIAVQLPATHWFYFYIMWFIPFVLVGLLVPPPSGGEPAGPEAEATVDLLRPEPVPEPPVLAGV